MPLVPEESEKVGPKSLVQIEIDLQMEVVEEFSKQEVAYFDEWVHIRTHCKKLWGFYF